MVSCVVFIRLFGSIFDAGLLRLRPQDGQDFLVETGLALPLSLLAPDKGRPFAFQLQHFFLQFRPMPGQALNELVPFPPELWRGGESDGLHGITKDARLFRLGEEQKQVFIADDFYIGKFEVTQAQWEALMGKDKNPRSFTRKGPGDRLVSDLTDAELA
jgi:hypothetical protein